MHSYYNILVHKAEEGGYWAEVPDLPGCFTEADTLDELYSNAKEAIALYLEDNPNIVQRSSIMQVAV